MDTIIRKLKEDRPNLKQSSISNYVGNLTKIYRGITNDKGEVQDLNFLTDKTKITEYLSQLKSDNTRKNALNVIIVFLKIHQGDKTNKKISELITDLDSKRAVLNKQYVSTMKTNQKSKKQEKNWLSVSEIDNIAEGYKKTNYQAFAVIKFHLAIPLRNDLSTIKKMTQTAYNKLSDSDQKNVNAIIKIKDGYELRLNNYKTSGTYNEKKISLPNSLDPIIRKLYKLNSESVYLIVNKNGTQFTPNDYTRYLNSLFSHTGKKISSTLLRNIVVSDKYGDTVKAMKKTADTMLHSQQTQMGYIKTD